jgi:glycine hydroxymethyltransferase
LRRAGFTLNRNSLPFDPNGPWYTSGLRVGTPAVTTLGMGLLEMREIAVVMKLVLAHTKPENVKKAGQPDTPSKAKFTIDPAAEKEARERIDTLLARFPVYPELDLEALQCFC